MNVLVPLADGFEEIEALTVVDVLRRAGLTVTTAGIPGSMIEGSRKIKVMADRKMDEVDVNGFDALVLPGGPGHVNLGRSLKVMAAIKKFDAEKKVIGAICMAPTILVKAGILENRTATVYPGNERQLPRPRNGRVVMDGHIITSQGPGTAMEFSLRLVEALVGREKAEELRHQLVY